MPRRRTCIALLAALIVATAGPAPAREQAKGTLVRALVPPEQEGDTLGTARAEDDPSARSAGMRLTVGSYVSVQVNVDGLGQNIVGDAANEPSIAVNPVNPNNMVIGWRQFDTIANNFRQGGWAFTMDGGETWTFPGVLTPGVFRSDPVIDTDANGNFYYQSLKSDFFMDVFKSQNGGVSWGSPVASFGGDKNWMVVDKSDDSIGDGHNYGFWREAFGCCGPNIFTRSINGAASFQSPVPMPGSPGLGTLAVGPEGEVYATGIDELGDGSFVVARSLDARNAADPTPSFATVDVTMGGTLVFGGAPNPGGLIGQANVAVDPSLGPTRGYVYLLSTVDPEPGFGTQPTAVHIARSENGGVSWEPPVRVNDDPGNNNAWHWFGAHSVAPNGRIDAIWNDTRDQSSNLMSRLFYAYSYDAGETWSPNVPVSPAFNSTVGWPNQSKIGDYYTIVSNLAAADVAYSATFNGEQDVYYVRVFPDCNGNGVSDVEDVAGVFPDCNGNFIPDSCEVSTGCNAAGWVPDRADEDEGEVPLLLARTAFDGVELTWGGSCKASDDDFAIYEGAIGGTFTSHTPRLCHTLGFTSAEFVPDAGDRYFLVVPRNATNEGSYGKRSNGSERPQASPACATRLIGSCLGSGGGGPGGPGH